MAGRPGVHCPTVGGHIYVTRDLVSNPLSKPINFKHLYVN